MSLAGLGVEGFRVQCLGFIVYGVWESFGA